MEEKFKKDCYEDVLAILSSSFDEPQKESEDGSIPPRRAQIIMLAESLAQVGNFEVRPQKINFIMET